ncbi:MAG: methylenetetrahydromethanopterin dehydrogenase [Proteobacteria bacterium]|nr:methylenetetrahydromethanopterin dehydrogenase [Pseudomonadota bacterium]
MERPYILHMITPAKNLSPFDVNMALDAGWDHAVGYTDVETEEVQALIQDAIFSRGPAGAKRTGVFLGGRDMHLVMDMLKTCQVSMVPPFETSCFADPSGAFTTAAGMMACVEQGLKENFDTDLEGKHVVIMGGTGPVGSAAALLAAKAGASVLIMGRQKEKSEMVAELCNREYGDGATNIRGEANDMIGEVVKNADVVLAAVAAGVQVISEEHIKSASVLKVVADVNAVPPSGIAGLDVMDDCKAVEGSDSGTVGIGALVIGNVKYQTQHRLLQQMRDADKPVYLHFEHAFEIAREIKRG